ncbi:MAG: hypothetical protein AAB393_14185 [Bacteroidota bacterium]
MKKSLAMLWAVVALFGLLATGCNKGTNGPDDENAPAGVNNEQSARVYFANNDEFVNNDEKTIDDQDIQPTDYAIGFGKVEATITPLRWGRFVTRVVRTVTDTVMPGDTIAFVHVHKDIQGVLRILALNANGDTVRINKDFNDKSNRNIIFKRVGREPRRFWLNWVPVATSLVAGGTVAPNNNINLTKIEFITRNDTITITDPLRFYLRYRWLRLYNQGNKDVPEVDAGANVLLKATVVSSSPDTDLVALRFGFGPFHKRRVRMHIVSEQQIGSNYERVFQIVFPMHFHRGFFHAAVDAATKATLFDDQAPYSVSWWGVPYRVL